jgi:hypothetical protein
MGPPVEQAMRRGEDGVRSDEKAGTAASELGLQAAECPPGRTRRIDRGTRIIWTDAGKGGRSRNCRSRRLRPARKSEQQHQGKVTTDSHHPVFLRPLPAGVSNDQSHRGQRNGKLRYQPAIDDDSEFLRVDP